MKRIDIPEIRKGDVIRVEYRDRDVLLAGEMAHEYKAGHDHDGGSGASLPTRRPTSYYLLDRPSPPVELPTEPTLGWIDSRHEGRTGKEQRVFGMFAAGENDCEFEQPAADEFGASGRKVNQHYRVTAFTPAVAVPKAALDNLRRWVGIKKDAASVFLAAVDEANR